jgi:hypothetical protein
VKSSRSGERAHNEIDEQVDQDAAVRELLVGGAMDAPLLPRWMLEVDAPAAQGAMDAPAQGIEAELRPRPWFER